MTARNSRKLGTQRRRGFRVRWRWMRRKFKLRHVGAIVISVLIFLPKAIDAVISIDKLSGYL